MGDETLIPKPWPWRDRPRVLLEHEDPLAASHWALRLARRGYAVGICHGPHDGAACPLVAGDGCPAVEGADVVVSALSAEHEAVVAALRRHRPQLPLVAGAPVPDDLLSRVGAALRDAAP
jgi:hypothetical protein